MRGASLALAFLATALSACAGGAEHGPIGAASPCKPVRVMSMIQPSDQIVLRRIAAAGDDRAGPENPDEIEEGELA